MYVGAQSPDIVGIHMTTATLLPSVYVCIDILNEPTLKSRQELLVAFLGVAKYAGIVYGGLMSRRK